MYRKKVARAWAHSLLFALSMFGLLLTTPSSKAQVSSNVDVRHDGSGFVFDFSGFAWRDEVEVAVLSACTSELDCREIERIAALPGYSFGRSGTGLFKVVLRKQATPWLPDFAEVLWEQYVASIQTPSADLAAAAARHAPLFSFHERPGVSEQYFPIGLGALFGQPIESFDFHDTGALAPPVNPTCTAQAIVCAAPGTPASRFMATNGHLGLSLFLKPELAVAMRGDVTDFPVYWFAEEGGNDAWITYAVFYAYDQKRSAYIAAPGASLGNHSIDRESLTLRFERKDGRWQPVEVVYAGHKDNQDTEFLACDEPTPCQAPGSRKASWSGGRTRLPWSLAAKRGNRPIAYVADGSHAMTPAYGWYRLDISPTVTEPAGNPSADRLRSGRLTQLDLNNPGHTALNFSGYLIDAIGNHRVFPFVRFPIRDWAAPAQENMKGCAQADCAPYIHDIPVVTGLSPTSATVGARTEFRILGENLAPMHITSTNCSDLTVLAEVDEELRFSCTPTTVGTTSFAARRSATGEVVARVEATAVPDLRELVLRESGGWGLVMRIMPVPKPGGVGRFEYAALACGGTLRYAGILTSTGEHVFQEDHEFGNCLKDCDIRVSADLQGYRGVCPSPPHNGAPVHSAAIASHAYTPAFLVETLRRAEGSTPFGLVEFVLGNVWQSPMTGADFKDGSAEIAAGPFWHASLKLGIADFDGIRVHFELPSACRALEIGFQTRDAGPASTMSFKESKLSMDQSRSGSPLPIAPGRYMLALRRLSTSSMGWTLHDTVAASLLDSGTVSSGGLAANFLNGEIYLQGYLGSCPIKGVRVTDWNAATWF